jgi:DNA polymerase-3 subunit delta'
LSNPFALIGQDVAVSRLAALFASDRFPHALLLEGPESVGKATAARQLARRLLCHRGEGPLACGQCGACVKVEAGVHADLTIAQVEEKTIKVDHIRELEAVLRLRPLEGERKVLIIPDAHRMSPAAQNALLKTLEEPPGRAHLILTTSRLKAMLPTVVSRCQRVPFAPIPTRLIALEVAEKRGLPTEVAQLIAALAHGSLGRALGLELEVLQAARDHAAALDRQLEGRTPKTAIAAMEAAVELAGEKAGMLETLELWSVWLHDQVLLASGADLTDLANLDRRAELESLAQSRGLEEVLRRTEQVMEAKRQLELSFNFNPAMVAEQLCLALTGHAKLVPAPPRR